jgi:hypothetical protein
MVNNFYRKEAPLKGLAGMGGGVGRGGSSAYIDLSRISYSATNGTPQLETILTESGEEKTVLVKTHGDGWYWMLTHTFGGTNGLTSNDSEASCKARWWMTTEQMGNLPGSYSLGGTMANTIDTKLRFSDTGNNYQTSAGSSGFWSMEGTANGSGSNYGSNQGYFYWWAHSQHEARLHIYGDLRPILTANCTHAHWTVGAGGGSSYGLVGDHNGNQSGRTSSIDHNNRASLGTHSTNGSHGYIQDGNGNTMQTFNLWMGHQ